MRPPTINLSALRKALGWLTETLALWQAQPDGTVLKPHLRSAVIQSFEFTDALSLRSLRRVLIERSGSADRVTDLSFNDLLRSAADACLLPDPAAWRVWRALRNATSHACDEARAEQVALAVAVFGSRATGRARPFSDLDLLLIDPPRLSWRQRAGLCDAFEASELPFRVDLVEAAGLAEGMAPRVMAEARRLPRWRLHPAPVTGRASGPVAQA